MNKTGSLYMKDRRMGLVMSMPMCIFTFLFVVLPFIYMIVLANADRKSVV